MKKPLRKRNLPDGMSEAEVRRIIAHYEGQTDEEATAEDEAAFEAGETVMVVPTRLVPEVRKLIARRKKIA